MNSRKLAGVGAGGVGAATAVVALLLGTLSGSAEQPAGGSSASAYALEARGVLPIPPMSRVDSPSDGSKALLEVPGPDSPGIYAAALKAEAESSGAMARATDVYILGVRFKLLESRSENGQGSSSIIKLDDDGKSSPYAGQQLNLSPILKVEFNRQTRRGNRLTVDAAVITLLPDEHHDKVITEKDLILLSSIALKQWKVPTMEQVLLQRAKSKADVGSRVTVGDLVSSLKALNPALAIQNGAGGVESVTVASSTSQAPGAAAAAPAPAPAPAAPAAPAAPTPAPVDADLPVTH